MEQENEQTAAEVSVQMVAVALLRWRPGVCLASARNATDGHLSCGAREAGARKGAQLRCEGSTLRVMSACPSQLPTTGIEVPHHFLEL